MRRWLGIFGLAMLASGCPDTCPPGYLRHEGQCQLVLGLPCHLPADCLSGLCLTLDPQQGFCTVTCDGPGSCPPEYQCHQMLGGLCVPEQGPECQQDGDCGACSTCREGTCRLDPACRLCQQDEDCDPCQLCQGGFCQQVAGCQTCTTGLDCPRCYSCTLGSCRLLVGCQPCDSTDECPPCHQCSKGACVEISSCGEEPCFNDGDCPPDTRCLPNRLLGFNTCLEVDLGYGSDCSRGGDPTCGSGICVTDEHGAQLCSRQCLLDDDCPWPDRCRYGPGDCRLACREPYSPPPGADCRHELDCDSGQLCAHWPDTLTGGWRDRCREAEPCGLAAGQQCQSDAQCRSATCLERGWCSPACLNNLDCPQDMACGRVVETWQEGMPGQEISACLPVAEVPLALGDMCATEVGCRGDGCLPLAESGSNLCTRVCQPGGEPCPDGFSCQPSTDLGSSHACLPAPTPGQCRSDADCTTGQVCRWSADEQRLLCGEATSGGQLPGQPCLEAGECDRGICLLAGICSAGCEVDADCPAGMTCESVWGVEHGLGGVFIRLCRPPPPSRKRCWGGSDCSPGEACRPWMAPGAAAASGRCLDENPTGWAAGQDCRATSACRAGVCTSTGLCASLCSYQAECPLGTACQVTGFSPWPGLQVPLRACLDVVGDLGDACSPTAPDCQPELFCRSLTDTTGVCTRACEQDSDCQAVVDMYCGDDGSGGKVCLPT